MKYTCIVVDDESPARMLLKEYIKKIPQLDFIGDFKSPMDAMGVLNEKKIDIIFLDIQMPGLTGIEFIKTLQHPPNIILTTAYSEYALDGYELDVKDYLMKPIPFERFVKAVNKVSKAEKPETHDAIDSNTESAKKDYILLKADHNTHRVKYNEILYIEGLREYVIFVTQTERIITLESLKKLESTLPDQSFIRVHKSFIVNKEKVKSLSGNQLKIDDKNIPIGLSYKDSVLKNIF